MKTQRAVSWADRRMFESRATIALQPRRGRHKDRRATANAPTLDDIEALAAKALRELCNASAYQSGPSQRFPCLFPRLAFLAGDGVMDVLRMEHVSMYVQTCVRTYVHICTWAEYVCNWREEACIHTADCRLTTADGSLSRDDTSKPQLFAMCHGDALRQHHIVHGICFFVHRHAVHTHTRSGVRDQGPCWS